MFSMKPTDHTPTIICFYYYRQIPESPPYCSPSIGDRHRRWHRRRSATKTSEQEKERARRHAQRRPLASVSKRRGGEALPGTNTIRKPIFSKQDSGEEEERPILNNNWPEKTTRPCTPLPLREGGWGTRPQINTNKTIYPSTNIVHGKL